MRRTLRTCILAAALPLIALTAGHALAQETVLIPTRVVYPGEIISADMLEEVPLRRQVRNLASLTLEWSQIEGKVARRTLLPGRMIPLSSFRDAWLVEPGKPVQVVFRHAGLEISLSGVPLQAGAAGEMVRVRNLDSGSVFTGVVMADGTVRVSAS